jgi:hypothetical protein
MMKRVYIPIIAILIAACIFSVFQWQTTHRGLRASQNQVQLLMQETNAQKIEISQLYDAIKQQDQQITNLQKDYLRVSKQADEALQSLERAIDLIEKVKFTFYYASQRKQRYGLYDLEDYLNRWQWIEGTYQTDIFDCSEMAAYLEWNLENEGYHAIIITGESPDGIGKHAWVLVEVEAERYMPVEPTTYSIVYWEAPYFDNYFIYEDSFETIQEVIEVYPTQFIWWE